MTIIRLPQNVSRVGKSGLLCGRIKSWVTLRKMPGKYLFGVGEYSYIYQQFISLLRQAKQLRVVILWVI